MAFLVSRYLCKVNSVPNVAYNFDHFALKLPNNVIFTVGPDVYAYLGYIDERKRFCAPLWDDCIRRSTRISCAICIDIIMLITVLAATGHVVSIIFIY